MNIAIIGAGNVGGTLGRRWQETGNHVIFGSRDPGKTPNTVSNQEAAKSGEVIVLATPWPAAQSAIESLGDITGKIVIDATNPLKPISRGWCWAPPARPPNRLPSGRAARKW